MFYWLQLRSLSYPYCVFVFSCLVSLQCSSPSSDTLYIATAANVQFAMEEIIDSFTQQTGIPCEIILGSSGKLTAQIQQGAPYDVFVSANMIYPNQLFSSGMTTSKPRVYAYGTLVLWTLKEDIEPSLEILKTDTIRNIATANPQIAP